MDDIVVSVELVNGDDDGGFRHAATFSDPRRAVSVHVLCDDDELDRLGQPWEHTVNELEMYRVIFVIQVRSEYTSGGDVLHSHYEPP